MSAVFEARPAALVGILLGLAIVSISTPASSAGLDPQSVNNATFGAKLSKDKIDPAIVKLGVMLDRAVFSPGEIDGKLGDNAKKALGAFARENNLPIKQTVTAEIWEKLQAISADPALVEYKISEADLKGPFLTPVPSKMEEMKDFKALGYSGPLEALAERFHMSEDLLKQLNPGKQFDKLGETIWVANVASRLAKPTIGRIEVHKKQESVKAFDADVKLVAFFPASIGSEEKPTPTGTLKVVSVDADPNYRYNPKYKFKNVKSSKPFTIKPGPNNPVGSYWIGLSADGYGIHGTANPSKVSKTESQGCVRLTNWDVTWLGKSVKKGIPVAFVDGPAAP